MEDVLKVVAKVDFKGKLQGAVDNMPKNTEISVQSILNWVYALAGLVAVGFIVYGAVNYVTTQILEKLSKQVRQLRLRGLGLQWYCSQRRLLIL